jgi:hypothetical protein
VLDPLHRRGSPRLQVSLQSKSAHEIEKIKAYGFIRENDDNVDAQRDRQARFSAEQYSLQTKLRGLQSGEEDMQRALRDCKLALESISEVSSQLGNLQPKFQHIRNDLFERRAVFTQTRMRLMGIRSELEMSQFSRTRRQLIFYINEALDSLTNGVDVGRHEVTILQLRRGISGIASRTSQLWNSLDPQVRQGL